MIDINLGSGIVKIVVRPMNKDWREAGYDSVVEQALCAGKSLPLFVNIELIVGHRVAALHSSPSHIWTSRIW